MKILIAEDDPVSRRMLEAMCDSWGLEVTAVCDSKAACKVLEEVDPPRLALLDGMMPEVNGLEVVKRIRRRSASNPFYIILLTAQGESAGAARGLMAEADDYVTKPFDHRELRARVQAGARVVELQIALAERVAELENALGNVKRLHGLLPICSYCKRIRDDRNYWQQVESYIAQRTEAEFTHGVCPQCYDMIVKPELAHLRPH